MLDTPGDDHTLRPDEVDDHHVNVQGAEEIFAEFSRTLSRRTNHDPEKYNKPSIALSSYGRDPEKGTDGDQDGRFDLREYLQSSNDANQAAGIKHKHVGVTWNGLEVRVFGGADVKVCVNQADNAY